MSNNTEDIGSSINKLLTEELSRAIDKSITDTLIYHGLIESIDVILRESDIDSVLNGINITNEDILRKAISISGLYVDDDKYNLDRVMKYIEIKRGTN